MTLWPFSNWSYLRLVLSLFKVFVLESVLIWYWMSLLPLGMRTKTEEELEMSTILPTTMCFLSSSDSELTMMSREVSRI